MNGMVARLLGATLSVGAALIVGAGCGGGDDDDDGGRSTGSSDEYFEQLEGLDSATLANLEDGLLGPGGAASAIGRLEEAAALLNQAAERGSEITPPRTLAEMDSALDGAALASATLLEELTQTIDDSLGEHFLGAILVGNPEILDTLAQLDTAVCGLQDAADNEGLEVSLTCPGLGARLASAAAGSPAEPVSEVTVVAVPGEVLFDLSAIYVASGEELVVTFENADAPRGHNIAFYPDIYGEEQPIAQSEVIQFEEPPVAQLTFIAGEPAIYYFVCDLHPKVMNGALVVGPPS